MCPVNGWSPATAKRAVAGVSWRACSRVTSVLPSRKKSTSFAGKRIVDRCLDLVAWPRRTHEVRRDDDGEIGFVLLKGLAREQHTQHRDTAEPRQLLDGVLVVALQQAADHEALAVAQFNGRRSATNGQRRHRDAVD